MRLKQIGKEIEGLKTKVPMYIDKPQTDEDQEKLKTEGDEPSDEKEEQKNSENKEEDDVFLTMQKKKK